MYVGDIYIVEKNYALVVISLLFTILSIIFVGLRIGTRVWLVRSNGLDDAFIVLSTFGTLGILISTGEQIRFGLGDKVDPATLTKFIQATVATVLSYTITLLFVKVSISLQCLRIFITPTARRVFLGFTIFHVVFGLICIFMTVFTCWPVQKYWDDSIEGSCLDSRNLRYSFAGINIVNDILLLVSPMPFLKSLQIPRKAKFVLMGVFACGSVACVVAIIRLYSLYRYSVVDIPQRPIVGVDIALWSGLECNVAIMCACVPALKPFFAKVFPRLIGTTQASRQRNASRYGHSTIPEYESRTDRSARDPADDTVHDASSGIKVHQSFEMRTGAVSEDNDSERSLVTKNAASWQAQGCNTEQSLPAHGRS